MQAGNERKPPLARVLMLRLAPATHGAGVQDHRSLTQLIEAAGGRRAWGPADPATEPPVDFVTLHPAIHEADALRVLDAAESERALRLRDEAGRQAYVYAHAALRILLARELAIGAAAIRFEAGPFGKPRLADAGAGIHFSISRRPGFVAVALGNAPLGVDVEVVRGGIDIPGISRRFFSAAEQGFIDSPGDAGDRVSRFFRIWSRKEALVKAAGVGIDALEAAEALKSLAALTDERGVQQTYCLNQLASAADHVLAIAIESPGSPG